MSVIRTIRTFRRIRLGIVLVAACIGLAGRALRWGIHGDEQSVAATAAVQPPAQPPVASQQADARQQRQDEVDAWAAQKRVQMAARHAAATTRPAKSEAPASHAAEQRVSGSLHPREFEKVLLTESIDFQKSFDEQFNALQLDQLTDLPRLIDRASYAEARKQCDRATDLLNTWQASREYNSRNLRKRMEGAGIAPEAQNQLFSAIGDSPLLKGDFFDQSIWSKREKIRQLIRLFDYAEPRCEHLGIRDGELVSSAPGEQMLVNSQLKYIAGLAQQDRLLAARIAVEVQGLSARLNAAASH